MQAGLQLSSGQESSLLAARRTLLTSLNRLANARSEILAALGMQLLQTHRVGAQPCNCKCRASRQSCPVRSSSL